MGVGLATNALVVRVGRTRPGSAVGAQYVFYLWRVHLLMTFSIDKIRTKQRFWDRRCHQGENVLLVYPDDGGPPRVVNLTTNIIAVVRES